MSKHRPWDADGVWRDSNGKSLQVPSPPELCIVARANSEADARLIAAAPQMLEALKDIANGPIADLEMAREIAVRAIAAAEGKE